MDPFLRLARALRRSGVRFVVIGLSGINLHARSASEVFATQDRDLFLPLDRDNALAAWRVSEKLGLELWCSAEPLASAGSSPCRACHRPPGTRPRDGQR